MSSAKTTGQVSLEKAISVDELDILLDISNLVISNIGLDDIIQSVHNHLPKLIPHMKSGIFFDPEKKGPIKSFSNLGFSENFIKLLSGKEPAYFLFGQHPEKRRSWSLSDYNAGIDKNPLADSLLSFNSEGILYAAGAHVILEGRIIGAILITRSEGYRDFNLKDLHMLELVANQIGFAAKNSLAQQKEIKEKEQLISVMEQKVKKAERMAALGHSAAIIAHEVKNPLTAIRLNLFSIEKKKAWKLDFDEDLKLIAEAVDRVSRTMEDLLRFSANPKLSLEEIDVNDILRNTILEYKEQTQNSLIFETELEKQLPLITADYEKLKEALGNLVSNAIAASNCSGSIRTSTKHALNQVIITIEDWGCGIPAEIMHRIYEPFFTTKQSGTGLGLAIAKKSIEAHRGSIEVESEPGWGTKFTIILPAHNTARTE